MLPRCRDEKPRSGGSATGRAYGVARVCAFWGVPRSSFYLARQAAQGLAPARPTGRRGPKPAVPDTALPAAIRADLARYNAQWLIEKNGHLSPHAQRRQYELAAMPMAA